MIYLCEREIGYDPKCIGFPSIGGCRAVVVVTAGGIFGFHLNGSLNSGKKDKFSQFISGHNRGGAATAIYVACKEARSGRDVAEIKEIATAIGYTGDINWADLSSIEAGSAYVEIRLVPGNNTCIVAARAWDDGTDSADDNRGAYVDSGSRTIANGGNPTQMYTGVDTQGMRAFYPTKV